MPGDNMPLNGGMNDGTYWIQLTGDEVSWEGRPFHYMEREELEDIWNRMAARRFGLRAQRHQLRQTVENLAAGPLAPSPAAQACRRQYIREPELSIMHHMWEEARTLPQQALAGVFLVEEHAGRGASLPAKLLKLVFCI